MTNMPDASDRRIKRERLIAILDKTSAASLALTSSAAISWYLDGARVHVNVAGDPIIWVRVSRDRDEVFVTSNELPRLIREELPQDIELNVRYWYSNFDASDSVPEIIIDNELRDARRNLLPYEVVRYQALAGEAAHVMTDALSRSSPTMTERGLAASVAGQLIERGADPLVLLVAGASRLNLRHPLPTDAPLGRRALLVVCARQHGLIASASRWVAFGAPNSIESEGEARIARVEAAILDATVPGANLGSILSIAERAYPDNGFSNDEWKSHHQGGATGYATRDPKATPASRSRVVSGQAFAWNPTAIGAKIEDTILVSERGIEVLTVDDRWPTTTVAGRARPTTLTL
jgi:Xaa-Pro aminopeptidase